MKELNTKEDVRQFIEHRYNSLKEFCDATGYIYSTLVNWFSTGSDAPTRLKVLFKNKYNTMILIKQAE